MQKKHIKDKGFIKNAVFKFAPMLAALFIALLSYFCELPLKSGTVEANAEADLYPAVIVDAGHGGFDGGAIAIDGTAEKDINLSIALKLQKLLELNGVRVIMTRTSDTATNDKGTKIHSKKVSDMQNRLLLMKENPQAVFVSIHLNKFTTSAASGAQTFYSPDFKSAKALAENIQKSIVSSLQPENRRSIKQGNSSTYLLYNAKCPAVIVECGFLSNRQDLSNLKSDEYCTKISICIFRGILSFLGENS